MTSSADESRPDGGTWSWLPRGNVKTGSIVASMVLVVVFFFPLFETIGGGAFSLFLLPVVLAGGLGGRILGVAVALMMQIFSTYVAFRLQDDLGRSVASAAISTLPMVILGYGVGRFRDLTLEVRRSNEELKREMAERMRLEEERRQLDRKFQEAQKMEALGILAGGIAHDFNNLLTGVLGNAGIALNELSPDTEAYEAVTEIEAAAQRAADLAKQMLAYSGRGKFVVERVDISDLAHEACALARASVAKKTTIDVDLAGDLSPVEADRTELHQVVLNLIINAAESLPDGEGTVSVRAEVVQLNDDDLAVSETTQGLVPGRYVSMTVSDTGCGMDEETRVKMFDPFFSTKFAGRGLGLAAVLGIVRGHDGAIHVDSELGRGTTITVFLPAVRVEKQQPAEVPQYIDPEPIGGHRILVVDDERMVQRLAERVLKTEGFHVVIAGDGQEATDLYRDQVSAIDLVLLDLTMPVMGGEDALSIIRQINPEAKVILSSGYSEEEATSRLEQVGVDGFLQKPYKYDELVNQVRRVLAE